MKYYRWRMTETLRSWYQVWWQIQREKSLQMFLFGTICRAILCPSSQTNQALLSAGNNNGEPHIKAVGRKLNSRVLTPAPMGPPAIYNSVSFLNDERSKDRGAPPVHQTLRKPSINTPAPLEVACLHHSAKKMGCIHRGRVSDVCPHCLLHFLPEITQLAFLQGSLGYAMMFVWHTVMQSVADDSAKCLHQH